MRTKILMILFVVGILSACEKEMNFPNEEANLVIGEWQLKEISGGYFGAGTEVYDMTIKFQSNGKCVAEVESKRTTQSFHFLLNPEGNNPNLLLIKLNRKQLKFESDQLKVDFHDDKMYLSGYNVYDGFTYMFERK